MVFGSGTGAVIREILKPRVPQSKSPPLLSHPNSTDANKDACRHSVSSVAFPPVMEFDRDLEDLNLCQALLEIAQSQERGRQGKQSDSSATAGSADALRMRLTKERAEEGFHVLCVRLVEENQGGRSGSGSLRQSSYCDQNAPAILSSLSGDMELDNDYFIVLLCCQEFCLGLESARQSQDNDNATEVLTMPALDKQTANPVQIFASASEDRLKDLDVRIRAEWGQRSRFERLGKNAVRDRIASKALAFRLESRLVQADNVGPILVNREEVALRCSSRASGCTTATPVRVRIVVVVVAQPAPFLHTTPVLGRFHRRLRYRPIKVELEQGPGRAAQWALVDPDGYGGGGHSEGHSSGKEQAENSGDVGAPRAQPRGHHRRCEDREFQPKGEGKWGEGGERAR